MPPCPAYGVDNRRPKQEVQKPRQGETPYHVDVMPRNESEVTLIAIEQLSKIQRSIIASPSQVSAG